MPRKTRRRSSASNHGWWIFALEEWIGLTLAFLAIVVVFCLFFIKRHTLEYHLQHGFSISDPEFIGSALALANPVLIGGNKIDLLNNGDEYFPAMLTAMRAARS